MQCNLSSVIERKDTDGIRVLKLAHGKVSAIDIELGEALIAELRASLDPSVKAVIITGTGSSLSAGVDLFRLIRTDPNTDAASCRSSTSSCDPR
jgi:enoyl-CoA hydratase/carnithine racemase